MFPKLDYSRLYPFLKLTFYPNTKAILLLAMLSEISLFRCMINPLSVTSSPLPSQSVSTIGKCIAIVSSTTFGIPSQSDASINTSVFCKCFRTSSNGRNPVMFVSAKSVDKQRWETTIACD